MANTLKLKQSAVAAKIPTTAQLQLGELAVNTYDGRLFTKKNVSGTESVVEFVSNSGTWGISITGNATTATTATYATTPTFSGDAATKDDITTRTESGFYLTSTGTTAEGWPFDGSWQHLIACTHSNDGNYYSMQLAGNYFTQDWYLRNTNNLGTQAWSRILHSNNYNSYSPTLTGTGASGTWGISITGNAATASATPYWLNLNATVGTNEIKAGTGDGATYTTYNVAIRSWWGIGFRDYTDNSTVNAVLDCRSGAFSTKGTITGNRFVSTVAVGTAPLGVTSTTVCTNLNADMVDGLNSTDFVIKNQTIYPGSIDGVYTTGFYHFNNTQNTPNSQHGHGFVIRLDDSWQVQQFWGTDNNSNFYFRKRLWDAWGSWHTVWNSGNDGSGSGLDADLLDGYHVGTSGGTIPLLNTANTWSSLQTLTAGIFLRAHNGTAPTAMFLHNGSNKLYLLLSDSGSAPSSTYNSLRPFSVDLTTGAVTMAQGVTITNGLTLTGGASITGGLSAYSATNDYTQATVKFGRNSNAYIALHGHGSGNYITHVVSDANPDPFRIALKTETLSWEHVFAMDGHIVPSIGIRCSATSLAPPATSTRSEGTRFVIYNSLGAATVDHAIGVNTNTQWYSIPQQSSRCFKWYAGITPIAALHGDGNHFVYDPGPTTQNTSVTLTDAQIRTCIIQSTPTAGITLTLPTSTNMNDTLWDGGTGMDWSVINLATDGTKTVTLAGNTNHTIVGNAVVAINSSARFRTIKSIYQENGLPVFTTYRIS